MPAALSGECTPCWDLAIVDRDQRVQLRSSLRADLEDMAALFEAVALRTRSTAPVRAVKDVATVDELLATWKEMFRGVCTMVLQCKHDLTDDWSPAKIGTELVNSRNSSSASISDHQPRLLDPGKRLLDHSHLLSAAFSFHTAFRHVCRRALALITLVISNS